MHRGTWRDLGTWVSQWGRDWASKEQWEFLANEWVGRKLPKGTNWGQKVLEHDLMGFLLKQLGDQTSPGDGGGRGTAQVCRVIRYTAGRVQPNPLTSILLQLDPQGSCVE